MLRLVSDVRSTPRSYGAPSYWTWCLTGLVCGSLLAISGCQRSFWRKNADDNTYAILEDKAADPRWAPPRLDLMPDARSRFFDPYDPDCEPLPPDDPTAHTYMHWMGRNMNTGVAKVDQPWTGGVLPPWLYPQRPIRGWKSWHKFGDTLTVENPQWLEPFGLTPEQIEEQKNSGAGPGPGIPDLKLADAIELSYIHSRDFQLQLENLYSTALALTFQRFQFDVRYLGFGGRPSASVVRSDTNNVESALFSPRAGISQVLPGGGQWIVEMANNTLWLFTGGNKSSTATTLSYSLVQPLLFGAGRQVVLEALTQAERNALYAMRDFARFRQVFFVQTVSGGGSNAGAYYGLLNNYQGVLNSRYNIKLLEQQVERRSALASETTDPLKLPLVIPEGVQLQLPQLPEKYANRLEYVQQGILNELRWHGKPMLLEEFNELRPLIDNVVLRDALGELFALSSASNALNLEVAQLLTQLASSRTQLLSTELSFQNALDSYKIQLGLPPDLWVALDVEQLKPFELISPQLIQLEEEVTNFVKKTQKLEEGVLVSDELVQLTDELTILTRKVHTNGVGLLDTDWTKVQENQDYRLANLPPTFRTEDVLDDYERDQRLIAIVRQNLERSLNRLTNLKRVMLKRAKQAAAKPAKPDAKDPDAVIELPPRVTPVMELADIREEVLKVVQNMEVIQINLRVELIKIIKFEMPIEEAVQTGLENRTDLMNQRALVMDARRKLEVLANALRSQLDLTAEGDISTVPLGAGDTSPFEFRKDQSSFRFGVQFTAPLDQVAQRNAYRQGLIVYQQARRAYMLAEDTVKINIRNEWRQLNVLKNQFEIARKNVRNAAMQYDQAVEASIAPVAPGQSANSSSANGLNLLNALGSVLNAQNNLIQFWVNYEANRLNIHRDMGIMQLDERGVWLDDQYQQQFVPFSVTTQDGNPTEGVEVPAAPDVAEPSSLPPTLPAAP